MKEHDKNVKEMIVQLWEVNLKWFLGWWRS